MIQVLIKEHGNDEYKLHYFHDLLSALSVLANRERLHLNKCNEPIKYVILID